MGIGRSTPLAEASLIRDQTRIYPALVLIDHPHLNPYPSSPEMDHQAQSAADMV